MSNEVSTAARGCDAAGDDASLTTDGGALLYGSPYLELDGAHIENFSFFLTQLFS